MHTRFHLLTAAVLAASVSLAAAQQVQPGGTVVTPVPVPVPSVNPLDRIQQAQLPPGITAKNLNEDRSIDRTFKNLTEKAVTKNGFGGLVDNLVDQDRDRLSKTLADKRTLNNIDGTDNKRLNDLVASFEGAFKAKYNTALDIDIKQTFNADFLKFQTGEVSDAQQLVGKWPIVNMKSVNGVMNQPAVNNPGGAAGTITQRDADEAKNKMFGGDVNLEKGRNVALAFIPTSHGMQGVNVSLIHESVGGWKIDVPNNITAEKLYNNLITNLTYVNNMKAQWPADGNEANRIVTHAVVAALYDITLDSSNVTASEREPVREIPK